MSKGKTKSSSTSNFSNTQTLNPWSQNKWQGQFDKIQGMLGDSPVQAYSGDLVAGLSGREQQARGLFEQNMGSFNQDFDQARGLIDGAGYNPQALGTGLQSGFGDVSEQYMNPYERQVVDTTLADINRVADEQMSSARGRAAASGAYGGSRLGVMEGQVADAAQRNAASTAAQLRYQGYNDARGFYGSDLDRIDDRIQYGNEQQMLGNQWDVQRGGLLADLASGRHQMNTADIMGLNTLGEVDRGIDQDRMGADYNEWLRQQDEEMRRIGIQTGLLGAIPMLTNSSGQQSSTQTQTTNPGLLGTLGQVGGLASMFVPGGQMAGLFSTGMKTAGAGASAATGIGSVSDQLKRLQMGG